MAKGKQPDVAKRVEAVLDKWFADRVRNSPASRDPKVYNHLHSAFDDLKHGVIAELGEKAESTTEVDDNVT